MKKLISLLLAPMLLTGCYNYSVVDPASVSPGMAVRARISASAAPRYSTMLGTSDARLLTGKLVDTQAGALTLEVPAVPMGTVGAQEGLVQRVSVARGDVIELESRKLDSKKTGILIGTASVGVGALIVAGLRGHSSGEGAVTEPPINFVVRLLSFHF